VSGHSPLILPVAVIQPLPGIGDMVWHLPHIRAIAAYAGEPVTLITKPRSLADQLLAGDPAIADIQWVDLNPVGRRGAHDGFSGFRRLVRKLRAEDFGSVVLLHHSVTLAAAAWLAGIPDRRGYGFGRQRWFLNGGPFLPRSLRRAHQHAQATSYLDRSGIPLPSGEPRLSVSATTVQEARTRLGDAGGAFVVLGIGSSESIKQWGARRFAELAAALLDAGWPGVVLLGGADEATLATEITNLLDGGRDRIRTALGWNLADVLGLLSQASLYVGNDTGMMNVAAAVGIRTYGLFGASDPFGHASQIVPVTAPPDAGMNAITVAAVLSVIEADRGRPGP
jgi:heptosyltransferase-2